MKIKIAQNAFLAALAALGLMTGGAQNEALAQVEKPKLELGVGGKPLLYYLPLTIAEQKGYFKAEGLDVTINDFGGGAKSLQSLMGGSVDVVTGAYEHTIRMQAKNQPLQAVIELGRFPGIVLMVKSELKDKVKTAADLKGLKIGVTAPGSSTNFFVNYLIAKAGGNPKDTAYIGVGGGAGAVAAMMKGEIDGMSNLDPVISKLEAEKLGFVLADSRTEAGTRAIFGGSNPAAVLYLKPEFAEKNPKTTQALVNALAKALDFIAKAKPDDIAASVPEAYYLGDKPLYLQAVKASMETYSRTGIISADGMKSAHDMLKQFDAEIAEAKIDLSKTFTDRFVKAVKK